MQQHLDSVCKKFEADRQKFTSATHQFPYGVFLDVSKCLLTSPKSPNTKVTVYPAFKLFSCLLYYSKPIWINFNVIICIVLYFLVRIYMMVYRLPKIYPKPIQIHLEVHYHIIMNVFVVLYLFEVKPVLMFVPVVSVFHKIN